MSDQRKIINLVWKQLEEIDKLKCEKDSEPQNAARTTYLQSYIYRKYVIVEFLIGLIENPMSKMRIQTVVGLKKEEEGAKVEYLREMPVPKLVTARKVNEWMEVKKKVTTLNPFPYLELPPEVRRTILDYLTNPGDKLNLAKAIPVDAAMMEWSLNSLRLELILPIVFDRMELGYQEAVNICHASAELHDVVKNCFGTILANPLAAEHVLRRRCKPVEHVDPADYVLNPIPSIIDLHYKFDYPYYRPVYDDSDDDYDDYEEWKLNQLDILRQFGQNVWSFHLYIKDAPSSWKMIQLIRDCVELMPNLKTLIVSIDLLDHYRWFFPNEDEEQIKDMVYPELLHLKHLVLLGLRPLDVLFGKLLEKYRSGLTVFETAFFSDVPITFPGKTVYPQLTHLDSLDYITGNGEDTRNKVLKSNTFVGSALKSISFSGGYDDNEEEDFIYLLCAFCQFGDTLEHLSVQFARNKDSDGDKESCRAQAELSQLADLNFPKVKTLEVRGYPSTWMFLLSFPALEKLTFNLSDIRYPGRHPRDYFDPRDSLNLSFVKEELYAASIWKLLPFLKTINIVDDRKSKKGFQVSRSQCLAYQRKLAEMKELMRQDYITIEGPVKKVRQWNDTTFVVEGDVNGNVVQQGNGIILVTGKVRGKIQQWGSGKIIVCGKHRGVLSKIGNGTVEVDWGNIKN